MKLYQKILLYAAAFLGFLGFGIGAPLIASAEEIPETPPAIEEIPETPEISAGNGEISNGTQTDEEIPEEDDKTEITVEDTTFEDFLAWAGEQAKEYGYGNDFKSAMESLKTAATTKQVTISTIASAALAVIIIVITISNKIKEGKFKQTIIELSQKLDNQVDGTNALINGTNENGKNGETTKAGVEKANAEIASLKKTLSLFINAFMRFTDGVKMQTAKKDEVQTNLLNALKEVEGGAAHDEHKA